MNRPHVRGGTARWALALTLVLVLPACSTGAGSQGRAPSRLADFYQQQIEWRRCAQKFECGKLTVPLDYDRPGGKRIELAVMRLPASKPDKRVGSLVVNPGGPGASGVQFASQAKSVIAPEVRARFDVVGFDPRGVGQSAPVQCLPDKALDRYFALDASPDTRQERQRLVTGGRNFATGCSERSGKTLPHVGTVDAARDMDVLRAALGDDGLTYLGFSYGTRLGATYAELFPDKVRAFVLDGAVDPSLTPAEMTVAQAKGFETALRAFAGDCVNRSECPLGDGGVEEALDRIEKFFAAVDEDPLPVSGQGNRELTQALAKVGMASALYNERYWPYLRDGLRRAFAGDGSGLLRLADALAGRKPDGSYTNLMEANMAITCVDAPMPEKVQAYAEVAQQAEEAAPHFGESIGWGGLPCAYWPVPAGEDVTIDAAGAPPILVVGTTRDPATPYAWAEALTDQLESGVLLTRKGDGHTAYRQGNACIDRAVDTYLIEGKPPEPGTVCG